MFKLVKNGFSRGFAMRSIKNETIDDILFILMNLLLFVMSHFMLNLTMRWENYVINEWIFCINYVFYDILINM
jgi:hypothetical protein